MYGQKGKETFAKQLYKNSIIQEIKKAFDCVIYLPTQYFCIEALQSTYTIICLSLVIIGIAKSVAYICVHPIYFFTGNMLLKSIFSRPYPYLVNSLAKPTAHRQIIIDLPLRIKSLINSRKQQNYKITTGLSMRITKV